MKEAPMNSPSPVMSNDKGEFEMIFNPDEQVNFNKEEQEKSLKEKDPNLWKQLIGEHRNSRHIFMSDDGMYLYSVGIIDYLQSYRWYKLAETKWKSHFNDPKQVSCVHPQWYAQRFYEFMEKSVIKNQSHFTYNFHSSFCTVEKVLKESIVRRHNNNLLINQMAHDGKVKLADVMKYEVYNQQLDQTIDNVFD